MSHLGSRIYLRRLSAHNNSSPMADGTDAIHILLIAMWSMMCFATGTLAGWFAHLLFSQYYQSRPKEISTPKGKGGTGNKGSKSANKQRTPSPARTIGSTSSWKPIGTASDSDPEPEETGTQDLRCQPCTVGAKSQRQTAVSHSTLEAENFWDPQRGVYTDPPEYVMNEPGIRSRKKAASSKDKVIFYPPVPLFHTDADDTKLHFARDCAGLANRKHPLVKRSTCKLCIQSISERI